ncbi:hypothetical protein D3C84_1207650 [compost metagenome]
MDSIAAGAFFVVTTVTEDVFVRESILSLALSVISVFFEIDAVSSSKISLYQ